MNNPLKIPLRLPEGVAVSAAGGGLLLYSDALREIPLTEAATFGEEPVQLRENGVAEWVLSGVPKSWRLREGGPVRVSRTNPHSGTLMAGNEAGLLTLVLEDETGRLRASAGLEIVSAKLGYREDFRQLLEDIARRATDLLLRQRTEMTSPMTATERPDPARLVERFFLLRGLLESGEFQRGLARVLSDPHRILHAEAESLPLNRARRLTPSAVRWLATATPRQPVPAGHCLTKRGLATVPLHLPHTRPTETGDTPENRFVKYALRQMLETLDACTVTERLQKEAWWLRAPLEQALAHPLFAEVGTLTQLPTGSQVLARRSGYREVYQTWLAAQQALQLSWEGGQEVFGAGRRDVATLYEYWCFFEVAAAVERVLGFCWPSDAFLTPTADGFSLALRRGTELRLEAEGVSLFYNPTLPTWTRPVRPDITLATGEIRVHFDAKYRLTDHHDALTDDILTMHAYRDALPGTLAAVALYPGKTAHWWPDPASPRHGLGALPLAPGRGQTALDRLLTAIIVSK